MLKLTQEKKKKKRKREIKSVLLLTILIHSQWGKKINTKIEDKNSF